MSVNAMTEEYEHIELFGKPALFTNARVDTHTVPDGWHVYDLRGSDNDPGSPCTLEILVVVNHAGSIVVPEPISFPDNQDYREIGDALDFLGDEITLTEFCKQYGLKTPPKYMGETVIPPELQYVEVISVTASSGYDANTGEAVEDEKELPSTVTLLVTTEQAKVLAGLEQESELHLALVYRGAPENADEFIAAQDALIEELYAEPEAEAAEGAENAESAETEESEGADPAAESEAAGE